jgi:hypothetical protein
MRRGDRPSGLCVAFSPHSSPRGDSLSVSPRCRGGVLSPRIGSRAARFDCSPPRSRLCLDRRLWGGGSVRDAAGQAGSFEGTPPRHFFLSFRRCGTRPRQHSGRNLRGAGGGAGPVRVRPVSAITPGHWFRRVRRPTKLPEEFGNLVDNRPPWNYKKSNKVAESTPPVGAKPCFLPYRSSFFWISERPHECQIGSGELVRNAVGPTFETRGSRSSASVRLRFFKPSTGSFGSHSLRFAIPTAGHRHPPTRHVSGADSLYACRPARSAIRHERNSSGSSGWLRMRAVTGANRVSRLLLAGLA